MSIPGRSMSANNSMLQGSPCGRDLCFWNGSPYPCMILMRKVRRLAILI